MGKLGRWAVRAGVPAAQVINFGLAPLQIVGARGHVGISGFAQLVQLFVEFRATVEPNEDAGRNFIGEPVERPANGQWQQELIRYVAQEIAHGCRSDQGQEQIGPGFHPIIAQAIGEAVRATRQVEGPPFRDIEQPGATDRCIDGEATERLHRLARLELQQEVQENVGLADVVQEVAQATADRPGQFLFVGERDRADECLVD